MRVAAGGVGNGAGGGPRAEAKNEFPSRLSPILLLLCGLRDFLDDEPFSEFDSNRTERDGLEWPLVRLRAIEGVEGAGDDWWAVCEAGVPVSIDWRGCMMQGLRMMMR